MNITVKTVEAQITKALKHIKAQFREKAIHYLSEKFHSRR